MELWIRSQDKTKLVKVNDVYIDLPYDFGRDTYAVYSSNKNYFENDNPLVLGRYKTKERTLEVLDEIHQRLIDLQMLEYTIGDSDISWSHGKSLDCVYFMPKEW